MQADLWSVGIILYELVVGRPPFDGGNHVQLLRNIERSEARIPDQVAAQLSRCCAGLIHQLLKSNPVERISFEVGARVCHHSALLYHCDPELREWPMRNGHCSHDMVQRTCK